MCVTYVTLADTRTVQINPNLKQKVIATLISKIEENYDFNSGKIYLILN